MMIKSLIDSLKKLFGFKSRRQTEFDDAMLSILKAAADSRLCLTNADPGSLDGGRLKDLAHAGSEDAVKVNRIDSGLPEELDRSPGIAMAIPGTRLRRGEVAPGKIADAVRANFDPDRSGDIYVVFEPHWFIADFDGLTAASVHGSPGTYDTHVLVIFAGPGITPSRVVRRVETVDVAPTIAAYLGTKLPSGAVGLPLTEVLE